MNRAVASYALLRRTTVLHDRSDLELHDDSPSAPLCYRSALAASEPRTACRVIAVPRTVASLQYFCASGR
jgi:hypothetical protein